jgi:hypothetical protein
LCCSFSFYSEPDQEAQATALDQDCGPKGQKHNLGEDEVWRLDPSSAHVRVQFVPFLDPGAHDLEQDKRDVELARVRIQLKSPRFHL